MDPSPKDGEKIYNRLRLGLPKRKLLESKPFLFTMAFYVAVLSLLIWGINSMAQGTSSPPQVDLGYEIHQGVFNVSG